MTIPAEKLAQLTAAYSYSPVLALVTTDLSSYTVTVDPGTNTFTASSHDFANGTPVSFLNANGVLPGGIIGGATYYVITATANTFQIATTPGGAAVDVTSAGSGTNTVTEQEISGLVNNYPDASVVWDVMVRHEVISYQGIARGSFAWGTGSVNVSNGQAVLSDVTVAMIPLNGAIAFRYAVVLRGANTTPGDSTGAVAIIKDLGGATISLQGYNFTFRGAYL